MSGIPNQRFKGVQYVEYSILVQSIYLWLRDKLKRTRGNTVKIVPREYFKWLDSGYEPKPIDCIQFYTAFEEIAKLEGLIRVREMEPKGSYKRGRLYLIPERLKRTIPVEVKVEVKR